MPVIVAGQVYGTLSFFSRQVRPHPFSAGDKELLKLMAQWVGALLERQQSEEELRQSEARFREIAQREALLNQLASQIRRSLDLNTILETAVHEIRNLLQIDRCFFLWYRPDPVQSVWEVVAESRSASFPSLIEYRIPITTFGPLTTRVFNKEIARVDNVRCLTDLTEQKFFFGLGYTALLALPIHTTSGQIGVVTCGHSGGPRPWRDEEVELLQSVADQLAIAIDQAELYKQSRASASAATEQATKLAQALRELQQAQAQLVQSEKMSSLGQLVAGVAHEINNPVSFIYGNLTHVNAYIQDLFDLIQLYQESYPQPGEAIQSLLEDIELDFIKEDLPKILASMKMGADRITQIVQSLRRFSRLDEAEMKWADLHEGLDSTLLILSHNLSAKSPRPRIEVIRDYGDLPMVQCYPGQLNQVFMNILSNAIDAIDDNNKERSPEDIKNHPNRIRIRTEVSDNENAIVRIIDNGPGMTEEVCYHLFEPFFTTKPVGQGTGLGLSISYKIVVEKHHGQLQCFSSPGQGAEFVISIPIQQNLES
jgi:signal transduction histidine kinase